MTTRSTLTEEDALALGKENGPIAFQKVQLEMADRGLGNVWKKYGNPHRLMKMLEKMKDKHKRGVDVSADLEAYHEATKEEREAGKEKKTAGRRRKAKKTAGRRKSKKAGRRTRKH
jgi:hypothetical protein